MPAGVCHRGSTRSADRRRPGVAPRVPRLDIGRVREDPPVPSSALLVALLVGAALPFVPAVGRVARIATTIVHEVGHCVVVVPFGGRIRRIDLHADGSGEAWVDLGRVPRAVRWAVRLGNLYAGYSAPLWAGALLVIGSVHADRVLTTAVLGVAAVVAVLFVRNAFGVLVVVGFAAVAVWVAVRPSEWTVLVVAAIGALFVVDGVRSVVRVAGWIATGAPVRTDFHIVASEYRLPAAVWYVLFVLVELGVVWLARAPLGAVVDTVAVGLRTLVVGVVP
ncbi:hypothetical protein DEI86_04010 [Curtobacterium sp. MCBD17_028]|nr:hypothetical protein DEI86_04010 [Curtobacterium sp. MCBD17_028]